MPKRSRQSEESRPQASPGKHPKQQCACTLRACRFETAKRYTPTLPSQLLAPNIGAASAGRYVTHGSISQSSHGPAHHFIFWPLVPESPPMNDRRRNSSQKPIAIVGQSRSPGTAHRLSGSLTLHRQAARPLRSTGNTDAKQCRRGGARSATQNRCGDTGTKIIGLGTRHACWPPARPAC
jgi:hypothetical protein